MPSHFSRFSSLSGNPDRSHDLGGSASRERGSAFGEGGLHLRQERGLHPRGRKGVCVQGEGICIWGRGSASGGDLHLGGGGLHPRGWDNYPHPQDTWDTMCHGCG